jgi:archaellum component FlaC
MTDNDVKRIQKVVKGEITKALEPINDKLDNHTASLMSIEHTLEGYSDMYKVNKEKIEDLDERVTVV